MSSKGQVVLPKTLRDKRGWKEGTEVEIEEVPEGILLRLVPTVREASLDDLLGCAGYRGPRRSLEDMEAAIREGARAKR
jgi:AbrB family looped-hinge helix DNA binding protein